MPEADTKTLYKQHGLCPYGEDIAHGAGCIKPAGHVERGDRAHCVTNGDLPKENWLDIA